MSFLTPNALKRGFLLTMAVAAAVTVAAVPAEAKKRKAAQAQNVQTTNVPARYKDPTVFPKGPVSYAGVYLGDDPDPFIRFQLLREMSTKFGGNE